MINGISAPSPVGPPQDSEPAKSWRPVLEGRDAERARAAVDAVAESLLQRAEQTVPLADPGFPDGSAGFALLFAYLALDSGDDRWHEWSERLLDQAIDALVDRPMPQMLFGGFTGIGWTIEHLARLPSPGTDHGDEVDDEDEPEEDPEEINDDPLLDALAGYLERPAQEGDFDLITGLAGLGVYALEALPHPTARRCLTLLIDRLAEIAAETDDGITWFTPYDQVPDHQRENAPHGYYNLGVAHGVPAVISVLGSCAGAGLLGAAGRPLLDGAVRWLLSANQQGGDWCYPAWVGRGVELFPARLAWCYGDPGVAAALLTAARHAGEPTWEARALEIARSAAARPPELAEVNDTGVCHGSAGLGHLFNRMAQATGDPVLADAARYWLLDTLDRRLPDEDVGGFLAYTGADDGSFYLRADPGVLMGAAGTALALLAAITPIEPAWDRVLTVSVPLSPPPPGRSGRA